ncbi:MAG TPA: ABC transporter substrate-binding protein [Gammaproteobacteria bacterium]|nr:ABC transporter substrate-binding protein [Gammaproteobacteria bacterium]
MSGRWTGKDILLVLINLCIVVLLVLTMYMIDRQWLKISRLETTVQQQAESLQSLERRLAVSGVQRPSQRAEGYIRGEPQGVFRRAFEATQRDDYSSGDWLVMPLANSLKTLSPVVSSDKYARVIQQYVIETLLIRDPDTLAWQGLLADRWKGSADGLTFDFYLRSEAAFSDGSSLTADDVRFSYEFIMDERIAAPGLRAYLEKIAAVEAVDTHHVRFFLKDPYFASLSLVGEMPVLSKAHYERFLQEPERYNQSKGVLLGSGPYMLPDGEAWLPESGRVELVKNDRYWGDVAPAPDKLVWRIIDNASARLTSYRNGELDAYTAGPREFDGLRRDSAIADVSHAFQFMPPFQGYTFIGWNIGGLAGERFFADPTVRLAMTLLTDRERIINEVKQGYAEPMVSPFNPSSPQHNSALLPRDYDPQRAQQLLREAGFSDRDNDGVIENKDGEPFEFELVFFQGREETRRLVLLLKDLYAQAGILLKPRPSDWPVLIDVLRNRNYDAITLAWTSGVETDIYQMFHSSQIADNGDNFVGFHNDQLDQAIDKARTTVDEQARMRHWQEAEAVLYEQQPYTFLYRSQELQFVDRRFQNLAVTKMGLSSELVPLDVYVPSAVQRYAAP